MTARTLLRLSLFPLAAIFVAALVFAALRASAEASPPAQPRAIAPRGPLLPQEQTLVSLFENAAPSVAYITTQVLQRTFFGQQTVAEGAGSGFVWDTAGHVVTNHHVIEDASRVFVRLDAGQPIEAKVIGRAPEYDLAVVQLSRVPAAIKPIPIGSSRDLKIGQSVLAIGNPFGLQRTLTQGIISALDRELPTIEGYSEVAGVIQTDAAIDLVNRIVPALIARGRAPRPGIGIDPFPADVVARAGISGVVIQDVRRGTPAAQAGLRKYNEHTGDLGDVIVAVNGRKVEMLPQFVSALDRAGIDSNVELTVQRDGKERRIKIRVVDVAR